MSCVKYANDGGVRLNLAWEFVLTMSVSEEEARDADHQDSRDYQRELLHMNTRINMWD